MRRAFETYDVHETEERGDAQIGFALETGETLGNERCIAIFAVLRQRFGGHVLNGLTQQSSLRSLSSPCFTVECNMSGYRRLGVRVCIAEEKGTHIFTEKTPVRRRLTLV